MSIPLNLNEVEAWSGGNILPPGSHVCIIDSAEEGTSSGGHPQIEVTLKATDGEFVGATIKDWVVVTQGSLGRVRQFLEAARVQIPDGDFDLDASALAGSTVRILIREEPGNDGKLRSRVKAYELSDDAASPNGQGGSKIDSEIPF